MELPYVKFLKYKTCPLAFYWGWIEKRPFEYVVDKRNAFIGLLLQKLVERFYLEKWWQQKDVISRMKTAVPSISQHYVDTERLNFTPEQLSDWLKVAYDTIPLIVAVIKAEKLLTNEVYVEREDEIPFGEHKLQAKPDLVVVRNFFTEGSVVLYICICLPLARRR